MFFRFLMRLVFFFLFLCPIICNQVTIQPRPFHSNNSIPTFKVRVHVRLLDLVSPIGDGLDLTARIPKTQEDTESRIEDDVEDRDDDAIFENKKFFDAGSWIMDRAFNLNDGVRLHMKYPEGAACVFEKTGASYPLITIVKENMDISVLCVPDVVGVITVKLDAPNLSKQKSIKVKAILTFLEDFDDYINDDDSEYEEGGTLETMMLVYPFKEDAECWGLHKNEQEPGCETLPDEVFSRTSEWDLKPFETLKFEINEIPNPLHGVSYVCNFRIGQQTFRKIEITLNEKRHDIIIKCRKMVKINSKSKRLQKLSIENNYRIENKSQARCYNIREQ